MHRACAMLDIFNFAIKERGHAFVRATGAHPPVSILGPPSVDERPLFRSLICFENSTTLVRHCSPAVCESQITIYFSSTRCKNGGVFGHTPSRSKPKGGGTGRFPPSGCETFSGNTFARLRLRGGEAVSPHKVLPPCRSRRPSAAGIDMINGSVPFRTCVGRSACAAG